MSVLERPNLKLVALIAFIAYTPINFLYFQPQLTVPDEHHFVAFATHFANTGIFSWGEGGSKAFDMPLPRFFMRSF